jgi:hypothetical protein
LLRKKVSWCSGKSEEEILDLRIQKNSCALNEEQFLTLMKKFEGKIEEKEEKTELQKENQETTKLQDAMIISKKEEESHNEEESFEENFEWCDPARFPVWNITMKRLEC